MNIEKEFIEEEVKKDGFEKIHLGYTKRGKEKEKIYKDETYHLYRRKTTLLEYLKERKVEVKNTIKYNEKLGDDTSCPQAKTNLSENLNKSETLENTEKGENPTSKKPKSDSGKPYQKKSSATPTDFFSSQSFELPELSNFAGVPLLENLKEEFKSLVIAFDAEWVVLNKRGRRVLSYQFAFVHLSYLYEYILLDVSEATDGNKLNLDDVLQKMLVDIGVQSLEDSKVKKKLRACVGLKPDGALKWKIFTSQRDLIGASDIIYPLIKDDNGLYTRRLDSTIDELHEMGDIDKFSKAEYRDWIWAVPVSDFENNQRLKLTLLCHFGRVDLSTLENADSRFFKRCIEVQKGVLSDKPIKFEIRDRSLGKAKNRYVFPLSMTIRDTMSLAPDGMRALSSLGDMIGLDKVKDDEIDKEKMDVLLNTNPRLFFEYASRDSVVTLLYSATVFGYNAKLPLTFTSLCSKALYQFIVNGGGSSELADEVVQAIKDKKDGVFPDVFGDSDITNNDIFDYLYRGFKVVSRGLIDRDGYLHRNTSVEPQNAELQRVHALGSHCYYGGLNACYHVGYFTAQDPSVPIDFNIDSISKDDGIKYHSYDFDVMNCYPTAMAMVDDWDTERPIEKNLNGEFITLDHFGGADNIDPTVYMMGSFSFKFPEDTYFPSIPISADGRLTFVLESGDVEDFQKANGSVFASGPEILRSLQLGATVYCHNGVILRKKQGSTLRDFAVSAIESRNIAKKLYGGKSIQQTLCKLFINALYGKISQGVSIKKTYDAYNDIMHELGHSRVTCPIRATMITGLVRALLNAVMCAVHEKGYKVYSVTTDGFISNIPEDELKSLTYYGFEKHFFKSRIAISGVPDLWEAKHYNPDLANFLTRGNMSSYVNGVMAKNGIKSPKDMEKESPQERQWLFNKALTRDGRIPYEFEAFTGFKELSRGGEYKAFTDSRKMRMDFDMKRKPNPATFEIVNGSFIDVDGSVINFDVCNFDTLPYKNILEAEHYHSKNKGVECLRTYAQLSEFTDGVGGHLDGIAKARDNYLLKVLRDFTRYHRGGISPVPIIKFFESFNIKDFVIPVINHVAGTYQAEFDGKSYKYSDWNKAKSYKGAIMSQEAPSMVVMAGKFSNAKIILEVSPKFTEQEVDYVLSEKGRKVKDKATGEYLTQLVAVDKATVYSISVVNSHGKLLKFDWDKDYRIDEFTDLVFKDYADIIEQQVVYKKDKAR